MSEGARSAITISVLGLLLVVAAVWGWSAATEPLPAKVDTPICEQRAITAGTKVFPQDVTVSVYNAGTREGLAGRTMQLLVDEGFAKGTMGNVRTKDPVAAAQIWTTETDSPAVQLLASRLGRDAEIVHRDPPGVGVALVVGDGFSDLAKGKRFVSAAHDTVICSPPVG